MDIGDADDRDLVWLYLLGRPNGDVKVGYTRSPRNRFNTHRYRGGVEWCHLCGSGDYQTIRLAERAVIADFGRVAVLAGAGFGRDRETFAGLSRDAATRIARQALTAQRGLGAGHA